MSAEFKAEKLKPCPWSGIVFHDEERLREHKRTCPKRPRSS